MNFWLVNHKPYFEPVNGYKKYFFLLGGSFRQSASHTLFIKSSLFLLKNKKGENFTQIIIGFLSGYEGEQKILCY